MDGGSAPDGALSAENLRFRRGGEGILLLFEGVDAGEQWAYSVEVVPGPPAAQVTVRCADTLFLHSWAGASLPGLAAHILDAVRKHNEAFREWRRQGGVVGVAEMRGIGAAAGAPCDAGLSDWLDARYRQGRTLDEGPANGFWVAAAAPRVQAATITMGKGLDPVYKIGRETPLANRPEYVEYAQSLKTAGAAMIAVGALAALTGMILFVWAGITAWQHRDLLALVDAWPLVTSLAAFVHAVSWVAAGMQFRRARSRTFVRIVAVLGMLPCLGPCFVVGIPVGIWVLVVSSDERAPWIFE